MSMSVKIGIVLASHLRLYKLTLTLIDLEFSKFRQIELKKKIEIKLTKKLRPCSHTYIHIERDCLTVFMFNTSIQTTWQIE